MYHDTGKSAILCVRVYGTLTTQVGHGYSDTTENSG